MIRKLHVQAQHLLGETVPAQEQDPHHPVLEWKCPVLIKKIVKFTNNTNLQFAKKKVPDLTFQRPAWKPQWQHVSFLPLYHFHSQAHQQ